MNEFEKLKITKSYIEANIDNLNASKKYIIDTIEELEKSIIEVNNRIDINVERLDSINKFFNDIRDISKEYDCFKIIDLKLQGKNNVQIAKELGIHKNTVGNKLKYLEEMIKNY